MHMCEQWRLHCTSQCGWYYVSEHVWALSERIHCVVVTFKMTEQVEQWTCITCALSLSVLLGNYLGDWEGCRYGQLVIGSFIMTVRLLVQNFLQNIKSPRWLNLPTAQVWVYTPCHRSSTLCTPWYNWYFFLLKGGLIPFPLNLSWCWWLAWP